MNSVDSSARSASLANKADASGLAIVETRLRERFAGGIIGEGDATHLRLERPDGTGTLICYERIIGSVGGHKGSFLLEAKEVMEPGAVVHGNWKIVDGSGTGELEGLRGHANFSAQRDEKSPRGCAPAHL